MCMILWRRQWGREGHQVCGSSAVRRTWGRMMRASARWRAIRLKTILCETGSQCSSFKIGVIWHDFQDKVTTRAAVFCICKEFAGNSFLDGWDGVLLEGAIRIKIQKGRTKCIVEYQSRPVCF